MSKSWLVVSDSARARIFDLDKSAGTIDEISALVHTDSRMPGTTLEADRPGRSFDSVGGGRHGMAPSTSPHEREADEFARLLADHLRQSQASGEYQRLRLSAPPAFLGLLRKHLDENVQRCLVKTVTKNLVHETPEKIGAHFFEGKKLKPANQGNG